LAGACGLAWLNSRAGADTSAQSQLSQIEQKQTATASDIDELNRQADQLLGQASALKQKATELHAALIQKQAELKQAETKLAAGEAQLSAVSDQLRRALVVLRERLVEIYKSDQPDMLTILLNQASWSDVEESGPYLDRIQNSDQTVVDRVHSLRDEVKRQVGLLTEQRDAVAAAKQSIISQQQDLVQTRAALADQQAQLAQATKAREAVLERLRSQSSALQGALNGPLQGGETVPSSPGHAGLVNGLAVPPDNAPPQVVDVINAANSISDTPYVWGGGHGSFTSSGYDCSGSVSFALHGGGFLSSPLDSTGLESWGSAGFGTWITVFATSGHAYMYVAGLRFDTGGNGGGFGPRWHSDLRDNAGFVARHPAGF
jgi:cell wall-associated NlpC family hydrolase